MISIVFSFFCSINFYVCCLNIKMIKTQKYPFFLLSIFIFFPFVLLFASKNYRYNFLLKSSHWQLMIDWLLSDGNVNVEETKTKTYSSLKEGKHKGEPPQKEVFHYSSSSFFCSPKKERSDTNRFDEPISPCGIDSVAFFFLEKREKKREKRKQIKPSGAKI